MTRQFFSWILAVAAVVELVFSCKSSQMTSRISYNNQAHVSPDNNLVSVYSDNTRTNSSSNDEIVFRGKNNLFEILQRNSAYFDQSHDVIIIEGSNTLVRLVNTNVLDMSSARPDTLVIVGSNQKYVIDVNHSIRTTTDQARTDVIHLIEEPLDLSLFTADVIQGDDRVRLEYFDSLVTVKFAHDYFIKNLETGQPIYFHELAEMYLYGLGVKQSTQRAIELYEYAAAKDYTRSLVKLGDIFTGRFSIDRDRAKSLYYYRRCQLLGDSYCDGQVKKWGQE